MAYYLECICLANAHPNLTDSTGYGLIFPPKDIIESFFKLIDQEIVRYCVSMV